MKICPYCAQRNREGLLFCEECGRQLTGITSIETRSFTLATKDLSKDAANGTWGTSHFQGDSTIVVVIRDADQPLQVKPNKRVIFGRLDQTSAQRPDVDLTPYGALEKGVSRIHCAIYRDDFTLTIVDMGSSNGTHLNGQRLSPEIPRVLRDGDELQLGKLVAHIYFKPVERTDSV